MNLLPSSFWKRRQTGYRRLKTLLRLGGSGIDKNSNLDALSDCRPCGSGSMAGASNGVKA